VIVLIDGRSGSGKTELATALGAALPGADVVHLDDLYPGWDGLADASRALPTILRDARWQRWDWTTSALAEWHDLDASLPIIVEGSGALTRETRPLADLAIWVEYPEQLRKARALAREPGFADHWDAWAAQEDEHGRAENPRSLADITVDGSDVAQAAALIAARL
jgi:uridine kinase